MDRKNIFKNNLRNKIKEIKMNNNNNMIKLVAFNYDTDANWNKWNPVDYNKDQVDEIIKKCKQTPTCLFENLLGDTKIKPFYDIDIMIQEKNIPSMTKKVKFIKSIKEQTLEVLKPLYPDSDIAVACSHGDKKKKYQEGGVQKTKNGFAISFHFVMNGYETTIDDLRKFNAKHKLYNIKFKDENNYLENDPKEIMMFDKGIYRKNGLMRMILCHKPKDERKKVASSHIKEPLKHFFHSNDFTNPNAKDLPDMSPPSSPPQSPKANVENDDDFEFDPIEVPKRKYDSKELQDILDICRNKECYEYQTWIEIGMALHNITEGDAIGLALYKDFSKDYDGFKNNTTKRDINYKWKSFKNDDGGNKLGLTYLRKLKNKYKPPEEEKLDTLEALFKQVLENNYKKRLQFWEQNAEEDEEKPSKKIFIKGAINEMLKVMNTNLIFTRETGDYIIMDKKIIVNEDGTEKWDKCWYLKGPTKAKDHFQKEIFTFTYQDGEKTKNKQINPFKEWCMWSDRREVRKIDFDPRDNCPSDIFNLWNGYAIKHEDCRDADETLAEPVLNHIKKSWCNGDEDSYNYVMNYLAHIIQKPHIKMGVLMALKSAEGGGKGFILDKIGKIIGDTHYCQNSNAKFLFGDFNGQLEGKILVNLDEAFWGGDKQLEGVVKNKITESRQTINKKNKENYIISCYANYIITTNNDWFCGADAKSRRMFCLELNDFLSGIVDSQEKDDYIKSILESPLESFAKVLYERDISDFNPRKFKKTDLLQNQVERNWNSVLSWWNSVMQNGGFTYQNDFIEWGTLHRQDSYDEGYRKRCGIPTKDKNGNKGVAYLKSWLYEVYMSINSDTRKFQDNRFYADIKKYCLDDLFKDKQIQLKKNRRIFMILPSLDEARKKWNHLQQYEYKYDVEEDDDGIVFDDGADYCYDSD
tara:strand:- start:9082 stop:11844 length:2763 start_codon:yes stop_codon:yes gene_type:complete